VDEPLFDCEKRLFKTFQRLPAGFPLCGKICKDSKRG